MDLTPQQLAGRIVDQIERQPLTFDMTSWVSSQEDIIDWRTGEYSGECGTTRCVAGWAVQLVSLAGERNDDTRRRIARDAGLDSASWSSVGAHLLGLDDAQAQHLFLDLRERPALDYLKQLAGR